MRRNTQIPPGLSSMLGTESRDFIVKAQRAYSGKNSWGLVFFGLLWTAFSSIFVIVFFGPILIGEEVHFDLNGVPTTASINHMEPLIFPGIFIGFFVLIGLALTGFGIYRMTKKGGYFVGTPTRLVMYTNGKIRSIDWEQFSGDIRFSGSNHKGTVSLGMRTGRMVSRKNQSSQYVPDVIDMVNIPNAFQVEKVCRERIKENDPTPAVNIS